MQQPESVRGHDGFRMKLDALHRQPFVAQTHDQAVVRASGRDREAVGEAGLFHDQGMVAHHGAGRGQAGEHAFAVMRDGARFAVHGPGRTQHPAAKGLADGLVTQAHAQHRNGRLAAAGRENGPDRDAGFAGGAGAGRDDEPCRRERHKRRHRDGIVTEHAEFRRLPVCGGPRRSRTQHLHDVVGKGIVVVDEYQHELSCGLRGSCAGQAACFAGAAPCS